MESFGAWVRRMREERGLSQRDLAERIGMDPTWISAIENDRREPSLHVLQGLMGGLDIDLPWQTGEQP